MLQSALCFLRCDQNGELTAAEVVTERSRIIQEEPRLCHELPTFSQIFLSANGFEVVDIYGENQLQISVQEETLPTSDWFEPY